MKKLKCKIAVGVFVLIITITLLNIVTAIMMNADGSKFFTSNNETLFEYDNNFSLIRTYNLSETVTPILISKSYCESWFFGLMKKCKYEDNDNWLWSFFGIKLRKKSQIEKSPYEICSCPHKDYVLKSSSDEWNIDNCTCVSTEEWKEKHKVKK